MAEMEALSRQWTNGENIEQLGEMQQSLRQLKEAQWWIEDVAETPGNEPGRVTLLQDVNPVADAIAAAITSMIEIEKLESSEGRRPLLAAMEDLRGFFTRSRTMLVTYVDNVAAADTGKFWEWLDVVEQRAAFLEQEMRRLTEEQRDLLVLILTELHAYKVGGEEVIRNCASEDHNVAQYRLTSEAVPEARRAIELLGAMTRSQGELMQSDARAVSLITNLAIASSVLLILLMSLLAWAISVRNAWRLTQPIAELSQATQKLAAGELDEDIPAATLTPCFEGIYRIGDSSNFLFPCNQ